MLYLKEGSLKEIGDHLIGIGDIVKQVDQSNRKEDLLNHLVGIINVLSDEISLGGHVHINKELYSELDEKMETAKAVRRGNTTFKSLNVEIGTELISRKGVKCVTIDENNTVEYEGKQYSISALAVELYGKPVSGFDYFTLNGKTLRSIRNEMDKK
jgi:hypothetical protein